MTTAPPDLLALRHSITLLTGVTDASALGIVGDDAHGKGYHLGVASIKARGNYPANDYSTLQTRDRVGGDYASGLDVTLSWPNGGRAAALQWSRSVAAAVKAGQLPYVSEINWLNEAGQKRRYTVHNGQEVSSSDTVDVHTHFGFWRDTEGKRSFTSLLSLMASAIGGTPVADWTQTQINDVVAELTSSGGPLHVRTARLEGKIDALAAKLASISVPTVDTHALAQEIADLTSSSNASAIADLLSQRLQA